MILLQVDPTQAIGVARELGTGSAQTVLAFVTVFATVGFGGAAVWAIRGWITEIRNCGQERATLATEAIKAQHATAQALDKNTEAIDRHSDVMKTALEALKK